jgi:hypothetical protein
MPDFNGKRDSYVEGVAGDDTDFKSVSTPQFTPEQTKVLWRKVDLRLMPILSVIYLFSFLDRGEYT